MKEESEKVGLKLNIQKTKILASGPITSWEIDGETVETVSDFIFEVFTSHSSVQFIRSDVSDSFQPHGLQHARPLCQSPTPGVYSDSCPLSRWCHSTISSFVVPFSYHFQFFPASVRFSSVTQSCPTLCDPMNRSRPGLPVHYQLPEFTQTHVHWVSDAIQPSHPLSSPSPLAPNPSQHQSLFQWVNSSHEVAKVVEFQL